MKITLLEVENYRRIQHVSIAPGDRSMVLIAGRNRQGKSSLLGAMSAALGGKAEAAQEPIRKGETEADIRVELDDGALCVHRRFLADGKTVLEVRSPDGKLRSPQAILDRIVGTRFLDPVAFMRLREKEQLAALLEVVDVGIDLEEHEAARKAAYDRRTEANRERKRLAAVLERTPEAEMPEPVAAGDELAEQLADLRSRRQRVGDARAFVDERDAQLRRLRQAIVDAERAHAAYRDETEARAVAADELLDQDVDELDAEIAELKEQLSASEAVGIARAHAEATNTKRAETEAELKRANAKAAVLTEKLEALDEAKAAALAAAAMPVEELGIGETGLTYRGVPLSQASGAEQLQVSLALAAAMSPGLQDIWVEDGALLDSDSLALVEAFAEQRLLRIWLERVGESDDGAVILEEGQVRA